MAKAVCALIMGALLCPAFAHADEVDRINRAVNRLTLRETVDRGLGPEILGCRLYVQEKRRRLIAAGFSPERLQSWTVATPYGLHGVLLIDGERVLDNLDPWTRSRTDVERSGYVFIVAQ